MVTKATLDSLPDIEGLRRLSQSLAMLDAIMSPEWGYRYYSVNSKWSENEIAYPVTTVFSAVGKTDLSIDPHKLIKVLGTSATIHRKMAAGLRKLGFKELSEFYSLEDGYYHWHYRPTRSKSRKRLIAALNDDGFTLSREEVVQPDD